MGSDRLRTLQDLVVTFTLAAYWLAATFSWWTALNNLKSYTSPAQIIEEMKLIGSCRPGVGICDVEQNKWNYYAPLTWTLVLSFSMYFQVDSTTTIFILYDFGKIL